MWFAAPGDSILTTTPTDNIFAEKAKELFGINVNFIDESKAAGHSFSSIEPWGWNVSLRRRLSNIGINEKLLPTDEQLANPILTDEGEGNEAPMEEKPPVPNMQLN